MQMDGHFYGSLQRFYEFVSVVREQNARHILNADYVRAHLFQLLGKFHEIFVGMHGRSGVAERRFAYAAVLLARLHCPFHVAGVVERIENTHYGYAVLNGLLDEFVHNVVRIVLVSEQVLTAQKHLQRSLGHSLFQLTQSRPGVFVQKTQAGVEGCAAPAFYGIVADFVELVGNGEHFIQSHAGSRLGLVSVS